jgi:DNA-binding NarL/FixJ family response regulator
VVVARPQQRLNDSRAGAPRILLVDRHSLVLAALGRLLSSPPLNAEVLLTTRSTDAIEIVRQTSIDLVLCDVKATGPKLPAILTDLRPGIRVILIADAGDERLLTGSLQCGARGFFTKDTAVEEFLEGVKTVLNGHDVVGGNLVHQKLAKLGQTSGGETPRRVEQLSPTEREILALIGQAHSVRSIAASRGITRKTVRNHLGTIYRKLSLGNRTEAILWAARMGAREPGLTA